MTAWLSGRGAALAFLLAACAASGCVATQRDVIELEQQTDEVKMQIVGLKKTIATLQANQADLAVKMDQMHSDVNSFNETMKDSQDNMDRLSTKIDDLQSVLAQKVSGLGETLSRQQNELAAKIDVQQQEAQKNAAEIAKQEAERTAAAAAAAEGHGPGQMFHAAQKQLGRKEYQAAAQGFETYLQKYPKGEMSAMAIFHLGEAYYGAKSWEKAARQFATVLDRYPKIDVIAPARLKYAVCLINLKSHLPEAKRYLQSIPEDYPKSPEAAVAQKLLKKLDATPRQ